MADANDMLMSGGVKSCSFKGTPPISWTGTILSEPTVQQKRDMDDGTPLTWPDGNPQNQIVVRIQTDVREDQDDDGVRGLYLDNGRKIAAVREAVKAVGGKGMEPGGKITLTYTSDDLAAQKNRGWNPPKNYTASYELPNPLDQVGQTGPDVDPWAVNGGNSAPPATSTPPVQTPVTQPAPSPQQGGVDPQLVVALVQKGVNVTPDMTQDAAVQIAKALGITP